MQDLRPIIFSSVLLTTAKQYTSLLCKSLEIKIFNAIFNVKNKKKKVQEQDTT